MGRRVSRHVHIRHSYDPSAWSAQASSDGGECIHQPSAPPATPKITEAATLMAIPVRLNAALHLVTAPRLAAVLDQILGLQENIHREPVLRPDNCGNGQYRRGNGIPNCWQLGRLLLQGVLNRLDADPISGASRVFLRETDRRVAYTRCVSVRATNRAILPAI
jgi:hypothetical protein